MAKHKDTPITSEDVKEYLNSQDDFALELTIYSGAQSCGLHVTHGGTYEDPITKKFRQYDLRVCAQRGDKRIELAIECKSLKNSFPLVISRIPRATRESFHNIIYSYRSSNSIFSPDTSIQAPAKTLSINQKSALYPTSEPVGKSTTQIGKTERDGFIATDSDAYEKWTQALTSAADLIQNAAFHHRTSELGTALTAVVPILVVADGTLWVADYTEMGKIAGEPFTCDSALLYVGREYWRPMGIAFTISHLHVYTKSGVIHFFDAIKNGNELWESIFPEDKISYSLTQQ